MNISFNEKLKKDPILTIKNSKIEVLKDQIFENENLIKKPFTRGRTKNSKKNHSLNDKYMHIENKIENLWGENENFENFNDVLNITFNSRLSGK